MELIVVDNPTYSNEKGQNDKANSILGMEGDKKKKKEGKRRKNGRTGGSFIDRLFLV